MKWPITKLTLYVRAMLPAWGLGVLLAAPVALLILFGGVLGGGGALLPGMIPILILFPLVAMFPELLPGFRLIKRQEDFFGFRFQDEMQKYGIHKFIYQSDRWFIAAAGWSLIALRRDYITALVDHETFTRHIDGSRAVPWDPGPTVVFHTKYSLGTMGQVTITCADGKTRKIRGSKWLIDDLEKWISEQK